MLSLRPTCEHCNVLLPADSTTARICSFECTFCEACVTDVLSNVCPNCGGGFVPRPIRPAREHRPGAYLGNRPASTDVVHKPVNSQEHTALVAKLGAITPEAR